MDDEEDLLPEDEAKKLVGTALKTLELALDGELRPLTPAVFVPPGVRMHFAENRTAREIIEEECRKAGGGVPTYEDDILRIQQEVDPIGMANAIVSGMSIPVYVPQVGGGVKVAYVQVSTRERMKILHKLMDRVLPPSSPRKAKGKDADEMSKDDPIGFLAAVERASALARARMAGATFVEGTVSEPRDPSYEESDLVEDDT
jgi:hypothetical protein